MEKLVRGEYEARLLDAGNQECYRATSGSFSPLNRWHPLYRPLVDEARLRAGRPRPVWPRDAPLAVCLTHDVDNVSSLHPPTHCRRILNQCRYLRRRSDARAVRALQSSLLSLARSLNPLRGADPLHAYEKWLAMEEEVGAKSTFLFLPDRYARPHYTDAGYRYTDRIRFDGQTCSVAEMMREMHRRGWEIGLHASWQTCHSAEEMKRQKEQVETALDAPVQSVRHHNIHFDVRRTPRVQHDAGLRIDSSLGFNDDIGFRFGTCHPWLLHDMSSGEELSVLELPLLIQDKCLVRIFGCGSEDLALEWADRIVERVRAVTGVLTLIWHPRTIAEPLYVNVYRRLLARLAEEGAWFGTMAQIGEWWLNSANHRSTAAAVEEPGSGCYPAVDFAAVPVSDISANDPRS